MIELFGFELGTPFQGGMLLTMILALGVWWIRGMPDRTRAKNEGKVIDDADDALKRREWREEIHAVKNEMAKVVAALVACNRIATAAVTLNEQMMFLYELLLSEQEHTDPESKIVQRARLMFDRISTDLKDPRKSAALHTAETAVEDAKQTLVSTKDTCEEVKRSENGE